MLLSKKHLPYTVIAERYPHPCIGIKLRRCVFSCEYKSIGICYLVLTMSCSMNVHVLPLSADESYEVCFRRPTVAEG